MIRQLVHEIKNPLGGLRGAAQLLERELSDGALREYTGVIIGEADRLTALVDSMAGPTRPPSRTLVNVHELCEHVYHLLRGEARATVLLERDYDPSLPSAWLDRHQIVQALLIAVSNPYRFNQREQVELWALTRELAAHVALQPGRPGDDAVAVAQQEDRGPGYLPEERERAEGVLWLDLAPLRNFPLVGELAVDLGRL